MAYIHLQAAHLHVAKHLILDDATWTLEERRRVALIGRNGAGKSSFLRLLLGEYTLDSGRLLLTKGTRVAALMQDVPDFTSTGAYRVLAQGLEPKLAQAVQAYYDAERGGDEHLTEAQLAMDEAHAWEAKTEIEMIASKLDVSIQANMQDLSGGQIRRVLLAQALIAKPEVLLLDEPTNHLDVKTIQWLEGYLNHYSGSVVFVTHDRRFLKKLATDILEIERGKLYSYPADYERFLQRREERFEAEERENSLFDKRLAEEEVWIRQGIKARRTRNEGRVRALKAMREERRQRRERLSTMDNLAIEVTRSGNLVLEANQLSFSYPDRSIVDDFSLLLSRGDKLGIIGPNGAGKTTLIKLLLGQLSPHKGSVRLGTDLAIAYFDQMRASLNPEHTLLQAVADGSDFVNIQGKSTHVSTYLRSFLFDNDKLQNKVSTLSGGEKNRLLLAKLFTRPVNLLVMDEPSNDLDIEALELLEARLVEYQQTLILISHDRDFIDNVVTSVVVFEEDGRLQEFPGSYSDYLAHQEQAKTHKELKNTAVAATSTPHNVKPARVKLSYNEQRELAALPALIEQLETEISASHNRMGSADFYKQSDTEVAQFGRDLQQKEAELARLYARWETLEGG